MELPRPKQHSAGYCLNIGLIRVKCVTPRFVFKLSGFISGASTANSLKFKNSALKVLPFWLTHSLTNENKLALQFCIMQ